MYINPDYPLLLPVTIARCWTYRGQESTLDLALTALTFALATYGTLMGAPAVLVPAQAWLGGLVLLGKHLLLRDDGDVGRRRADRPLFPDVHSASVPERPVRWSSVVAYGPRPARAAGFAAWTKNDGSCSSSSCWPSGSAGRRMPAPGGTMAASCRFFCQAWPPLSLALPVSNWPSPRRVTSWRGRVWQPPLHDFSMPVGMCGLPWRSCPSCSKSGQDSSRCSRSTPS